MKMDLYKIGEPMEKKMWSKAEEMIDTTLNPRKCGLKSIQEPRKCGRAVVTLADCPPLWDWEQQRVPHLYIARHSCVQFGVPHLYIARHTCVQFGVQKLYIARSLVPS